MVDFCTLVMYTSYMDTKKRIIKYYKVLSRPPSLMQIAKLVGVSKAYVHKVINQYNNVQIKNKRKSLSKTVPSKVAKSSPKVLDGKTRE